MVDLLPAYLAGKISLKTQNDRQATTTKLLNKESGFVPLSDIKLGLSGGKSVELDRLYRAMQPWPGIWTLLRQGSGGQARRLKITKAHLDKTWVIDEVQLESRNPVTWKQFKLAYSPF